LDSPNVALRDRQRHLTSLGVLPELAYFGARIANVGSCWQWTGGTNGVGYGTVTWRHVRGYAHRLMYERCIGPIPAGTVLDHLCRNTLCCKPDHLEPVTNAENIRRSPLVGAKRACAYGHDFTPENTYVTPAGARQCIECNRRRARELRARRSESERRAREEMQPCR
jgi:hypothetical protein